MFNVIIIIITNEVFVYLFIYYFHRYIYFCRGNINPWQEFFKKRINFPERSGNPACYAACFLFLLLKCRLRLSHEASHVVWAVVKCPSPPALGCSTAARHRQTHTETDTQTLFIEYHETSAVRSTIKISLSFFVVCSLKLCCAECGIEASFQSSCISSCSVAHSFERISPTMSANTQQSKCCPIPTRVLHLKDWSQLPDCYSQTPGGTLFSTTPGGKTLRLSCVYSVYVFLAFLEKLYGYCTSN